MAWNRLRKNVLILMCILLLSIFAACGTPESITPSSSPPGAAAEEKKGPAEQPTEWDDIVAAAKKEGKIVIAGDPTEAWRKSLVDLFQEDYPEIKVEYTGINGRDFYPRVKQERELGKHLWDLRTGGVTSLYAAKKDGFLEPIRPMLRPEIADESKWIGGLDGLFMDTENKYMLAYTMYIDPTVFVNRDFISESELSSSEQLLDPQFKGKIVIQNPTGGVSFQALASMGFMYGESFVRDLLSSQNVVVTDDNRQQAEWVVRGKYPIAIGLIDTQLIPFQQQGLGKNITFLKDKVIPVTSGFGGLSLLKDAPHPNAAKVYINWLLSKETQIKLTRNVLLNSKRTDVPPVSPNLAVDPAKIEQYRQYSREENVEFGQKLIPVIKESLQKK